MNRYRRTKKRWYSCILVRVHVQAYILNLCNAIYICRVTPLEITRCVEQILPDLLSKAGDPTARIHNLAVHTILSLADVPEIRLVNFEILIQQHEEQKIIL